MRTRHSSHGLLILFAALVTLAACVAPPGTQIPAAGPTAGAAATQPPQVSATAAPPSTTALPPATSAPLPGTWLRITAADGLCSDWPRLLGHWFIGGDDNSLCYPADPGQAPGKWVTSALPAGLRATAAHKFPPGGGLEVSTNAGLCLDISWQTQSPQGLVWDCSSQAGNLSGDLRGLDSVNTEPVLMLTQGVAYAGTTYSIPDITGVADAHPTWIAVSGGAAASGAEIWAGTDGYGVVVIDAATGHTRRFTRADGLPGDVIRDVNTGGESFKGGAGRDVWVATDGGVAHWDGTRWTAYTQANGLPSDDVRGVASRAAGTVWAATAGGAAYFDGRAWTVYTSANGLPDGDLNGVALVGDQTWFTTRGSGLLIFSR